MVDKLTFMPFLLVLFLAVVIPLAVNRIRWLPVVVGEILVGILIGRSGLKLISPDLTLDFLAEIGLAFLMFLSGLEIDFSIATSSPRGLTKRRSPLMVAATSLGLTLILAGGLSLALNKVGLRGNPWMVALILSTTSLGVVLPVLKERNLSAGLFGQTLLLAALLADFITMLLITVLVAVRTRGFSLDLLLVGVLFVAALLVYRLGLLRLRRIAHIRLLDEISGASSHLKVQGALALLLAFVVLSNFLGAEMILGAFLAGAVLSLIGGPDSKHIRQRVGTIGFGLFIPMFFITVGIKFDFPSLLKERATWLLAPLLILAAFLLKITASLVFRLLFSWRQVLAAGILLSSRLSLIIAAAGISLRLGLIDESVNSAFILIAALTSTLAPLIFNGLQSAGQSSPDHPIGIYGIGALGLQVAGELRDNKEKVVFMESDPAQVEHARQAGFQVIPTLESLSGLGTLVPSRFKSLLVLTSDDSRNIRICREAQSLGMQQVVALVNRPARLKEFADLGIQTFVPDLQRATLLSLMARNPDLFRLMTAHPEGRVIEEAYVASPAVAGRRLRDLRISGDLIIVSIHRGREVRVPHGNTQLERGDVLTVLGDEDSVKDFKEKVEG
jgi:Kef-type K+ transport system membrane component KefB/Trk K+ transport system NAD-binding subunit